VTAALPVLESLTPAPRRVLDVRRETDDVVTLRIEGGPARFEPGQFNMLYAFGIGEAAISMSGDAADGATDVHTIRALGAVTQALTSLRIGDVVGVRGPFGRPWPVADAEGDDLVIVGGGLGLAPLRPVVYHALRNRARYRRVVLLAGARHPGELLFADELARWRDDAAVNIEVRLVVDRAGGDWKGRVGVVPDLVDEAGLDGASTVALLCGPEVMMKYAVRPLRALGVPEARIFLSMERSMRCAAAFCGHCQYGPAFVCKDGPVFSYERLRPWFFLREL
jgi:NAD(P)H-flavin reductase